MYGKRKQGLAGVLSIVCAVGFLVGSLGVAGNVAYADEGQYAVAERELTIDGVFVGDTIQLEEEPVVEFTGSVSEEEGKDVCEYSYTAERDGKYRFVLSDVTENCEVRLYVYDSLGNKVVDTREAETVSLTEQETYTVKVCQYDGNANFKLSIYSPKPITDITKATEIKDQIFYTGEENRYTYTAPYNGTYRFSIVDKTLNMGVDVKMYDKYGTKIINIYSGFGETTEAVELEAGESYPIYATQGNGKGNYVLKVWTQKPSIDVTGYTKIIDNLEYESQRNYITFTPPVEGTYEFSISSHNPNFECSYSLYDNKQKIFGTSTSFYTSQTAFLEAGKTYTYSVVNALSDYEIDISYPLEAQSFLDNFVPETEEQEAESDSADSETEAIEQTEDPRVGELQEQNAALESELAQMKEENDMIMEALKDLGVDLEQETE